MKLELRTEWPLSTKWETFLGKVDNIVEKIFLFLKSLKIGEFFNSFLNSTNLVEKSYGLFLWSIPK